MTGLYKVRRADGLWAILNPDGDRVAVAYYHGTAVWLANNFAVRARVRRVMKEVAR